MKSWFSKGEGGKAICPVCKEEFKKTTRNNNTCIKQSCKDEMRRDKKRINPLYG